jgi:hypothetical protein
VAADVPLGAANRLHLQRADLLRREPVDAADIPALQEQVAQVQMRNGSDTAVPYCTGKL